MRPVGNLALAALLAAFLAAPAAAQQALPGQRGVTVTCGPSNNSPACQEIRRVLPGGAIPGVVSRPSPSAPPLLADTGSTERPDMDDVRARRLIPPQIRRFLADPRIDSVTRAYLIGLAGKPNDDWTVRDLQMVAAIIPTLTEMQISTATLAEFYAFMGLDPASLFEPQLGAGWLTETSTAFDPRTRFRRNSRCVTLSHAARTDSNSVRMQDLLTCGD